MCYIRRTYKVENNAPVFVQEIDEDMLGDGTLVKTTKTLADGQLVVSTSTEPH
jgi:hypothetical protein